MTGPKKVLDVLERDLATRNAAKATRTILMATATRFLAFAKKRNVERLSPEDVRRYLAARSGEIAASSQAGELSHLRGLFRALGASGIDYIVSPTENIKVRTPETPPRLLLPESAVLRLLDASLAAVPRRRTSLDRHRALSLRDRALVELLYGIGLRASEACAVLALDVQLGEGALVVRRAKRGESRALPLPPSSVPHMARYVAEGRPALVEADGRDLGRLLLSVRGRPLDRSSVWRIVTRTARRAGLRAYPHALRRAVATHLIRSGVSVEAVRQLLGHRSLAVTGSFVSVDPFELEAAVGTLDAMRTPGHESKWYSPTSSFPRSSGRSNWYWTTCCRPWGSLCIAWWSRSSRRS